MRMVRELRGLSKEELARRLGWDTGLISRIESGFMEGISFRRVHRYMQEIYGTLIAVAVPFPSFINHNAHRVQMYVPSYVPTKSNNLADDNNG